MRLAKALLAALAVAVLAGCTAVAAGQHRGAQVPVVGEPTVTAAPAVTSAPLARSVTPKVAAAARPAAARFYAMLSAGKFAASWHLLAPAVRSQLPLRAWVGVHAACPTANLGKTRVIKSVTVFGDAAIVATVIRGATAKAHASEDVFNYVHGHWSYSPPDLGIYEHGSVAADVTAARVAALCGGRKSF